MSLRILAALFSLLLAVAGFAWWRAQAPSACGSPPAMSDRSGLDLAAEVAAGRVRAVNRQVKAAPAGGGAVAVSSGDGAGVVWLNGTELGTGSIEVDVCGRDVVQQSFVGIAFHRETDDRYEGVYLRPFNFRADDATAHGHAVQYIAVPNYDWPRLRQDFPQQFESSVPASVAPTAWVPLRVDVASDNIRVFVGGSSAPVLDVRRLQHASSGPVGLWVGNGSDGVFANLRISR